MSKLETKKHCERMATGKISAKRELLWNDQGTWPQDSNDQNEAPFGKPINFWVPYVDNQAIRWDSKSGFSTKKDALHAAISFREKCIKWLEDNEH